MEMAKHDVEKTSEKGICPICNSPNGCAIALKQDPNSCWCMSTKVPEELLNQIPEDKRGKQCVCKKCVEAFAKRGV